DTARFGPRTGPFGADCAAITLVLCFFTAQDALRPVVASAIVVASPLLCDRKASSGSSTSALDSARLAPRRMTTQPSLGGRLGAAGGGNDSRAAAANPSSAASAFIGPLSVTATRKP